MAFDNVQYGPGLAYFPAASLSYGESCHMNFGSAPFKYPFDKQRKKKQEKEKKKVKTSFRESVLQFRKIMVGPPDWHKFFKKSTQNNATLSVCDASLARSTSFLHNSIGFR